ncbi:hypothetical protein Q7C36_019438, partial [Tachysurus vachellii]
LKPQDAGVYIIGVEDQTPIDVKLTIHVEKLEDDLETCPLSRSASVISRKKLLIYRSMAPLALTESALDWWKSHETELLYQSWHLWKIVRSL